MPQPRPPLSHNLQFEKKNHDMLKLPKHARISKRPIPHPPVASPYAGASVPKTVYVSTNSPFMSAVKRVQKLLRQAEKRATSVESNLKRNKQQQQGGEGKGEKEEREEIFVKATGRAIEKALSVGKWFEEKETEYTVRVKTGSVLVVDDIIEDEAKRAEIEKAGSEGPTQEQDDKDKEQEATYQGLSKSVAKKRKRAAKALAESESGEVPETRTRWVNMVEVAVGLK